MSLVPEKRAQKIFYRIMTDEGKTMHKVAGTDGITVQELDEKGQEINQKYMARKDAPRSAKTPQERVTFAEELVKKAEEALTKAQERLKRAQDTLEAAKAELNESLEPTNEDSVNDELM
jgi:capsule polysaccharide export protein KpsE/RkpR